jgi:tRNA (mo5U34)-methyltransferase
MAHDKQPLSTIQALEWYHTIDLGNGIVTPGHYDHRPYLEHYKLPENLEGKRVIDIGAGSGFFSFEFERRGASVVATELPEWFDHDFGPNYQADKNLETGEVYLHQPFEIARQALGSQVGRKLINIYDLSPQTVGVFDLAFCGSVLLHLTDPLKAMWNIASVTHDLAIIATVIEPQDPEKPIATFKGHQRGDVWWFPTRACLELMAVAAGFVGIAWVSEFHLDLRDGSRGPYHGVLHGYKTPQNWSTGTRHRDEVIRQYQDQAESLETQLRQEVQQLRTMVDSYERSRIIRAARLVQKFLARLRQGSS